MTIQWLGHAGFRITHQGYSIVIDPYNSDYINGYPKLCVKADRLLVSHEHFGHNYREGVILSGRPETECPFEIETIRVPHDFKMGNWRGYCLIHILKADGMKIVHMGDIGCELTESQLDQLRNCDFLLIPPQLFHYTRYLFGSCLRCGVYFRAEDLSPELIARIPGVDRVLGLLGGHSGNMYLFHNQLYAYYFLGFFYSFRHWALVVAALAAVSLIVSIAVEWIKEKTGYNRAVMRLFLK